MEQARLAVRFLLATALAAIGLYAIASGAESKAAVPSRQVAFACFQMNCGMPQHGAYPHLVVGRIVEIADVAQAQMLFETMRRHGHWSALPDSADVFWKNLQPVAIDAGSGAIMVTLTSQDEMHAAPLKIGDFVRYSPHRGQYETPPTDKTAAAFWGVDGCVAVLCRAGDKHCMKRYVSGLFRTRDGVQLSPRTLEPLQHGIVIDAQTMLPGNAAHVK